MYIQDVTVCLEEDVTFFSCVIIILLNIVLCSSELPVSLLTSLKVDLVGCNIFFYYFRSVSRAVQNLVQPDSLQSQAVDVRMELDLRIGKFQMGVFLLVTGILLYKILYTTLYFFKNQHSITK